MAHICYECKLGYGHPLTWCPGCGRPMIKVKQVIWDDLRKNNWRLEGDKGLYEHFLDGQPIDTDVYEAIVSIIKNKYPHVWNMFDLGDYDGSQVTPTSKGVRWVHADRNLYLILEKKNEICITFYQPRVTWRLKGSNLPIKPEDMSSINYGKEYEFDNSKLGVK